MKKILSTQNIAIVLAAVAIFITAFVLMNFAPDAPTASATGPFYTNIGYTATSTTLISVTSSTRIAATSSGPTAPTFTRMYASICNASANPVFLNLNGDAPASISGGYTTVIAAAAGYSACYEITDRNTYNGSIQASSTNQTATAVSVQQFVQ